MVVVGVVPGGVGRRGGRRGRCRSHRCRRSRCRTRKRGGPVVPVAPSFPEPTDFSPLSSLRFKKLLVEIYDAALCCTERGLLYAGADPAHIVGQKLRIPDRTGTTTSHFAQRGSDQLRRTRSRSAVRCVVIHGVFEAQVIWERSVGRNDGWDYAGPGSVVVGVVPRPCPNVRLGSLNRLDFSCSSPPGLLRQEILVCAGCAT